MTNIVMLCRGRMRLSEQALNSLFANTDPDTYTLTVVSDAEDDFRITKMLRSIQRKNFTLLEVSGSGHVLATLKNLGVAWSAQRFGYSTTPPSHAYIGDWLAIFDNDVCFFPNWLPRMISAMERSDFGDGRKISLLGGNRHPFHGINKLWGDEGYIEETDAVAGYSLFMRWSAWEKYGPFPRDCAPGIGQSEDFWLSRKIIDSGDRVGYINPPCLAHCGVTDSNGNPATGADQIEQVGGVVYL